MITGILAAAALALPHDERPAPSPQELFPGRLGPYAQQIFFAVHQGLYEDGISNEVVDRILAVEELGERGGFPKHFVWACPACMPAYDAFRVYRERPEFAGLKLPADTFGRGLPDAMRERILAVDDDVCRAALQELIQGWIERRMTALRLTDEERDAWRLEMATRRKQGMAYLERYREEGLAGSFPTMTTCPTCEGANGACRPR